MFMEKALETQVFAFGMLLNAKIDINVPITTFKSCQKYLENYSLVLKYTK